MMLYWPNPAHKLETSEAGPPRWQPAKEACPRLTIEERNQLLASSVPLDVSDPRSRRYALRMGSCGFEFFEAKWTRTVPREVGREADEEFHGHPTARVPASVLRQFHQRGDLSETEYRELVKEMSC